MSFILSTRGGSTYMLRLTNWQTCCTSACHLLRMNSSGDTLALQRASVSPPCQPPPRVRRWPQVIVLMPKYKDKRITVLICAIAVATYCTISHACPCEPCCRCYSPAGPTWVVQSTCSEQHGPPRQARLGADGPALLQGHKR